MNFEQPLRKFFRPESQAEIITFSLVSLPVAWLVLQTYHMLFCAPLAKWLKTVSPFIARYSQQSLVFPAALINLFLWGTLALLFPVQGFGHHWKPERRQGLVVLACIGLLFFSPALNTFLQSSIQTNVADPFRSMGFATWTLTPIEEEILFRGFIFALLLKLFRCPPDSSWRKALPALILGSAWFALWHLHPHAIDRYGWKMVLSQTFLTFWGGLLFNAMRHWTGSIWLVIPLHAIGNFMVNFM